MKHVPEIHFNRLASRRRLEHKSELLDYSIGSKLESA